MYSQSRKRKKPNHSEDPNSGASSSSTTPHGGHYKGGDQQRKGNDYEVADSGTSGSSTAPTGTNFDGSSSTPTETTNGASSSSAVPTGNHYEVFLSFRGRDTRTRFTDHLYNGLKSAGIQTFIDNNELHVGKNIGPELVAAIKDSKILIPIISVNYGTSSWCLDELVQIMECKNNTGHIVLPIFYGVEPSHVRHQMGSFGKAFYERERRLTARRFDPTILEKWKKALFEVSHLKGWEANGYEAELVKLVVQRVLCELGKKFELVIPEYLIGIDSHVKKVLKFVDNNSCATLFIGIHGMGGIGKTTLAKTIYNELSKQFQYRSFIADIRESCKRYGIEYLQKQLISDVLKQECKVSNRDEGIGFISSKFKGKKVLILLDDADDDDQLKALAGNHNWFLSESMIIITTRIKSILDNAKVDCDYELLEMDEYTSSILFSRHAFKKDAPPSEFQVFTRDVVSATGGLPLSLEVLGSFLHNKKPMVWSDTIRKLREVPHKKVQEKLRISYDALDYGQQQIFLDIACFLIGTDWRIASYMWDTCGFYPNEGIEVLRLMSLIKVGDDHRLGMHDQLRDLGRFIVRQGNESRPQDCSRLWNSEEALKILEENEGTSKIEALCLGEYFSGDDSKSYTAEKFKELINLRFLQANCVNLTGDFQNLFPQLRYLEWHVYFSNFEAANFRPKELVVLDLSWSKILEDWGGWGPLKMATKLKLLNLAYCPLRTTPNLSAFKSLEILILEGCKDLEEIHPSIEDMKTLVSLNVMYCSKLKELPPGVGSLTKLEILNASECALLAHIPSSIGHLASLSLLNLSRCINLAQLPDSIGSLVSLKRLLLSGCSLLREVPDSIGQLASLIELRLEFTALEELPSSIGSLNKLKTLDATGCTSLARIPNSIGHLASLSLLNLTGCYKLAQLPNSIGSLATLQCLLLTRCILLREIPDSIGQLASLTELRLDSTALEELPSSIGSLKELKTLNASDCLSLARIPSSIGDLASLSLLDLTKCCELTQLPDSIGSLVSLECLSLSRCPSFRAIPYSIGNLTSLTELHLKSTAIVELPESIGNMQNLRILDIRETPIVKSLGTSGIAAKLQELRAAGRKNLEGLPSNTDKLISPDDRDLDKLQKLSELRSRVLDIVLLKRLSTPHANNSAMDYQTADSEHVLKRSTPSGISDEKSESTADVKPRIADESGDKSRIWKLTEINETLQCRSIRLHDNLTATRVSRLIYTNSGRDILALSSNAVHKLWKWHRSVQNLTGRATTSVVPQLWQPSSGTLMINDISETNPEDAVPCFALSKNDFYLVSASGREISLFNMLNFKTMWKFMPPPPPGDDIITIGMEDSSIQIDSDQVEETKLKGHRRIIRGFAFQTPLNVLVSSGSDSQTTTAVTFIALHPLDSNIIAIGTEDSIYIYNIQIQESMTILRGHHTRITGLAFSKVLNVLVSSGTDSQLCVWSTDGWEKQASKFLQMPTGPGAAPLADTRVQFHMDQIHLLVVHKTQITTYEAPKLECLKQWDTREASSPITDATYSCNGQSIYVSFEDGSIGVLTASTLRLRCRINPAAYIPPNPSFKVYPLVIAAHPSEPNQFALGLTDGSVYVLEPLESEGKWGNSDPVEDGAGPSTTSLV